MKRIHRRSVDSHHKAPVMRKAFLCHDVTMRNPNMLPDNEGRRYSVTSSLIGWAHAQKWSLHMGILLWAQIMNFGYRCVGSRWHLHYKWWRHSDAFVQSPWPWVSSSGHNLLKYSVLINLNLSCFVQCIYMMYVNCILWRPRYRTILYYACLNEDMKLTVVLLVISSTYFLHVNSFPLNKMVAITQTTFSNAFAWVEMYRFRLKFPRV